MFMLVGGILQFHCDKDNPAKPKPPADALVGTVKNTDSAPVHPAFIFSGDSLLAETGSDGQFSVQTLDVAQIQLICSAVGYADETARLSIENGKQSSVDFILKADTTKGRVYGEFQNLEWFNNALQANEYLEKWNEKEMFEAVTGATMQMLTMDPLPTMEVYLGNERIKVADDWGQFWVDIQCGTYALKGAAAGYTPDVQVLEVLPETKHYIIFYLDPQ